MLYFYALYSIILVLSNENINEKNERKRVFIIFSLLKKNGLICYDFEGFNIL